MVHIGLNVQKINAMTREEAIHEIKQWDFINNDEMEALRTLIPELRESEDERIRKALVWHLKAGEDFVSNGVTKEECITYLEKQKYDRMKPIYDAKESFESALEKAWNDYHNGYENVDKLEDDYVECAHAKGFREGYLFGLEKQKAQKPAWSEEDKKPIDANHIVNAILSALSSGLETDEILKARGFTYDDVEKWLYSTRNPAIEYIRGQNKIFENPEKYGLSRPTEWSEEDEKNLELVIDCVYDFYPDPVMKYKLKDWLTQRFKSLRPCPSWKPSDEQMNHLCAAVDAAIRKHNESVSGYEPARVLKSLYEDLKKLM